MTHTEKLQQIFEAALKDNSEFNKPLTRTFPATLGAKPVAVSQPAPEPEPECEPESFQEVPPGPVANAGLSDPASAELAGLLEEQQHRKTRERLRRTLMTLGIFTILTGNAFCWFVNSPQRVVALSQAIQDIRSVGDVGSTAAKYQVALDKIAVRSKQIDQATAAMGVKPGQDGGKDSNMDAEMLTIMGGNGTTSGQRNQLVQHHFGPNDQE